jgi:hypothetical protein
MKRTSILLFTVNLLLWTAGCGGKGTITGTVTYKGTPIPAGTILFVPSNGGPSVNAPINDGKYTAEKVPTGRAKVSITSMYVQQTSASPMMMMGAKSGPPLDAPIPPEARKAMEEGMKPKKGLQIPDKYADPAQSGLTYTVRSGQQTKDFNLE